MKLSNYTICVDDYPLPGESLLFNTRTQALVKINSILKDAVSSLEATGASQLNSYIGGDILSLVEMGLLVRDEAEDADKINKFFYEIKYGVKESSYPVTILTTYDCNFRCIYCFEQNTRQRIAMNIVTADKVMAWLKKKTALLKVKELYLIFYGGEPLLNKSIVEYIAHEMKMWCRSNNLNFKFMLQTNGYLLNRELIADYLELGLSQVRISLDGVARIHDRNRPFFDGGKTFDKIMKNILDCLDLVKIGISTSYDKGDVSHIEELLRYLDDIGIINKLGDFIFSPIHPVLGPVKHEKKIKYSRCMVNYQDENLFETIKKIDDLVKTRQLPQKSSLAANFCPLTRVNSGVTIDPMGRIYKCNSMLGHPEFAVGDVDEEGYNMQHESFVNLDIWKKCPISCAYLPMCAGGCRMHSYFEKLDFNSAVCHKKYLDQMVPFFIKRDYEQKIKQPL